MKRFSTSSRRRFLNASYIVGGDQVALFRLWFSLFIKHHFLNTTVPSRPFAESTSAENSKVAEQTKAKKDEKSKRDVVMSVEKGKMYKENAQKKLNEKVILLI